MSWLEDKAWSEMSRVDTGPRWMRSRLGTLIYIIMGAIFFIFCIVSAIDRMTGNATAPSTNSTNTQGAF